MKTDSDTVWPMQPGGGVFLTCVGIGLLCGVLLQGRAILYGLEAGFVAGTLGVLIAIKLARGRFGRPTARQQLVMRGAIVFEIVAFTLLVRSGFFSNGQSLTVWAVSLAIVSLHFIAMRWSHGPWILWLALTSLCWIGLAYGVNAPLPALIAGYGLLEIGFGIAMAAPLWKPIQPQTH